MRKITTIDCEYVHPKFAASYLVSEREAYFVETNTAYAVPKLLHALEVEGLDRAAVRYIIVTHAHLDHAAGAHALMDACPDAILLAHPRAARHLIDPSRLEASARVVYGDEAFEKLYGHLQGIAAARVRAVEDGGEVPFAGGTLRFLHTRGHANHHMCVFDERLGGVFTGDSFGLAFPAVQNDGLFIFPSTSPTDFAPAEAKASVDRILATGANRVFLTHFGEIQDLPGAAKQLHEHLDFSADLLKRAQQLGIAGKELQVWCETRLRAFLDEWMKNRGIRLNQEQWDLIAMDVQLNAAGIAYVAEKQRIKG